MLKQELDQRKIPEIWDGQGEWETARAALLDLLCREEYGFPPEAPLSTRFETISTNERFCAGKAPYDQVRCTVESGLGTFSFPIHSVIPAGKEKLPAFVLLNFRSDVPDMYLPSEELCDLGFAVFSIDYQQVVPDRKDEFAEGLSAIVYPEGKRQPTDGGKLALWAWAASRAMDYVETLPQIDLTRVGVVGHSRLGKAALLAGALDSRFTHVFSNDSGCSGAALARGNTGEQIRDIMKHFPFWFCENYGRYVDNAQALPFDQHALLAMVAPRKVYVASAWEDAWADPRSEYLSCVAADALYRKLGLTGFVHPDRWPEQGDVFQEGHIGYHLRPGKHFLSREDWLRFVEFMNRP